MFQAEEAVGDDYVPTTEELVLEETGQQIVPDEPEG